MKRVILKYLVINIFYCGGQCMEDVQTHLRLALESIPDNRVPSADTLLRGIKELATENTEIVTSSGKSYDFNINEKINVLNLKTLLLTGQIKEEESYDFDNDNISASSITVKSLNMRSMMLNAPTSTIQDIFLELRASAIRLFT